MDYKRYYPEETIYNYAIALSNRGYEVCMIGLYGSQNYGLDEYSEEY